MLITNISPNVPMVLVLDMWGGKPVKGTQAVGIEFFVYMKSCQYSMFYTNKML
jgi:hypothetical protein